MKFIKDIFGGAAIILAAGGIGLVANAMRDKPLTLIPRVPTAIAKKSADTAGKSTANVGEPAPTNGTDQAAEAEASSVPIITDEEIVSGELTKERVKWLIEAETVVLIDARGPGEYMEGRLPGAINIPYDAFVEYYDRLVDSVPMDTDIIIYCRSVDCDLSDNLAQELKLMGYERVVLYRGGVMEWEEAGYELETME